MIPEPNQIWVHHSGKEYLIICVANKSATKPDYPLTVVYSDKDLNVWSRPFSTWLENFTLKA